MERGQQDPGPPTSDHFLAGLGGPRSHPLPGGPGLPRGVEGVRTRARTTGRARFPGGDRPAAGSTDSECGWRQVGARRLAVGTVSNARSHGASRHGVTTLRPCPHRESQPHEQECRPEGARGPPGSSLSKTRVRQVSHPQGPQVTDIRVPSGRQVLPPGPEPR